MEVLYGLHPVEEAVRSGAHRLDCVLLSRERGDARLERLAQLCRDANVRITLESRDHGQIGQITKDELITRLTEEINARK